MTRLEWGVGMMIALLALLGAAIDHAALTGGINSAYYAVVVACVFGAAGVAIGRQFGGDLAAQTQSESELLSPRELEVLAQLHRGKTNLEIAAALHVSNSTIKTHLHHIYQKLEVRRRTEAVHRARELGLLP